MSFKFLIHHDIQRFIDKNLATNTLNLALQKNPFPQIDFKEILNQIETKTKAKDKLPTWFETPKIVYPNKISVEQTSSELAAKYKSSLISGKSIADVTGGFGVDSYYFSKQVERVVHFELNDDLSDIAKHNFNCLDVTNIECFCGNGTAILKDLNQQFDWIYCDPSRRSSSKGKVFLLSDCEPDVTQLLDLYFQFSNKILIKTAPILDISAGINQLKFVKKVHIVAIKNEVKELLFEIEKQFEGAIAISTVNFSTETQFFSFFFNSNATAK